MKNNILKFALLFLFAGGIAIGCNDFLEGDDSRYAYEDEMEDILERNPESYLLGIYSRMIMANFQANQHDDHGQRSMDVTVDLTSADMVHIANRQWFSGDYNLNNRMATGTGNGRRSERQWMYSYANINDATQILASIPADTQDELSRSIIGECYALRAHNYFNLINIFQTAGPWDEIKDKRGVVIMAEKSNSGAPMVTVDSVYRQIINDIKMAVKYLDKYDRKASKDRIDINVAKAMYARFALYRGDYTTALEMAGDVIDAYPSFMSPGEYQEGFNSLLNTEWLWGAFITTANRTSYNSFFSIMDPFGAGYGGALAQYKGIDRHLYDVLADNDVRKGCFGSADGSIPASLRVNDGDIKPKDVAYLQYKYYEKVTSSFVSDLVFMRVSEMYYIKAECLARLNREGEAKDVLDIISNARAISGTHKYTWKSGNDLILQISEHKRAEMWGEGQAGFEYNRLKIAIDRTYAGTNHPIKNILGDDQGDRIVPWGDKLRLILIPEKEFNGNPNLDREKEQNPI